ncbi:MAG: hypothetical protein ACO1NW_08025 [Chitinophagaceae bacterium]
MKSVKFPQRFTMKCMIIAALLAGIGAHAKAHIPADSRLRGNWFLSSNTNEWVLGFYDKVAYFKNGFGTYRIIKEKKNAITVKLLTAAKEITLLIAIENDSTVTVNAHGENFTLTNRRRRQSSAVTMFWDKRRNRVDDTVRLKGYMHEIAKDGLQKVDIVFTDPVLGKTTTKTARISAEGLFNISMPITLPDTYAFIRYNSRFERFVACPGDTITVCLSPEGATQESSLNEVAFGGNSGALNNEFNTFYKYLHTLDDYTPENQMLKNTTQEAYRKYVIGRRHTADSAIGAYDRNHPLSYAVRDLVKKMTHYKMLNGLLRYRMNHNPPHSEPIHPETFKLVQSYVTDDSAGYAGGYHHNGFVREMVGLLPDEFFGYSTRLDSAIAANLSFADLIKFIKKNHHSLTERDLLMLDSIADLAQYAKLKKNGLTIDVPGGDNTAIALLKRMYVFLEQLDGFSDYFQFYLSVSAFDYKLKRIAAEYPMGYFRDYFLGHYLNEQLFSTNLTFLDDKLLAYLKTLIYDPVNFKIIEAESKIHEKNLKLWVQNDWEDEEEEYGEEAEWE